MSQPVPQILGEWVKRMGFIQNDGSPGLAEDQLEELSPINMRPTWRHIIKHVRPKKEVEMIRKNLLLHKLRQATPFDKKINMALDSSDELEKYLEMIKLQKELRNIEKDEHRLRESVKGMLSNKKDKMCKLERTEEKIKEQMAKSELCNIKLKYTEGKIKELVETVEIISELKTPVIESSIKEFNENKMSIVKCIPQVKDYVEMARSKRAKEDEIQKKFEYISNLIRECTFSVPPKTEFIGFIDLITSSNYNLERMAALDPTEEIKLLTKDQKHIEEHLVNLWKSHGDLINQFKDLNDKLTKKTYKLEECKKELITDIQNFLKITVEDNDSMNSISEYVSNSSKVVSLKEMLISLKENKNKTVNENHSNCIEPFQANVFQSSLRSINNDFYKKCVMLLKCKNSLAFQNERLGQRRKEIRESIVETLTLHFNTVPDNPIPILQESVDKEFELFVTVPFPAITRSWQSILELDYKSKLKILNTPLSDIFLRPDKDCFVHILELICWNQTLQKKINFNQSLSFKDKNLFRKITDFENDLKKDPDEIKEVENEADQLSALIHFWRDQPLVYAIPEELQFLGDKYSVWKDRQLLKVK